MRKIHVWWYYNSGGIISGGLCDLDVTGLRPPLATRHNYALCAVGQ